MKIYDCFTFYNELELLELRLKLLSPYVDYFVLAESNITFRGDKKTLYYQKFKDKFKKYSSKIIYLNLTTIEKGTTPNDWSIEYEQRNIILQGLKNCQPDDIIIISDVDEFPNPYILKSLRNSNLHAQKHLIKLHRVFRKSNNKFISYYKYLLLLLKYIGNKTILDILNITPLSCSQNHFYYYMNYLHPDKWYGSVISLYKNMTTPQNLRNRRRRLPVLNNGGWHFAYLGGVDRILQKVNSTVDETPISKENEIYTKDYINSCLKKGTLIYKYQSNEIVSFKKLDISDIGIYDIQHFYKKYPYLFL